MSRFTEGLNDQIANELAASQQYVAIAVHYDAQTLPQLAAHFYRQAVEERNHAMMIVRYLLDAGAQVEIPGVQAPVGRGNSDFGAESGFSTPTAKSRAHACPRRAPGGSDRICAPHTNRAVGVGPRVERRVVR